MLPDFQGHGLNRYVYARGDTRRFQTGAERTLLPEEGETNEQFAQRVERHVREAFADPALQQIMVVEEIAGHAITGYRLIASSGPRLAPIAADGRVAGTARHGATRGVRGGERHRPVLH